jgi:hypothetical protein
MLLELVEPARWQKLQDHFASVVGVAIRTISPSHQLLVSPSWPASLSADRAIEGLKIGEELEALLPRQTPPNDIVSLTTTLGVTYAAVPIAVTPEDVIAYFVIGPMIVGPREEELQFRKRITAAGLNSQVLWPLILSLKLYTFSSIRSVLHLLQEVGTSLAQLAYQAKQLSTILPSTSRVDQAVISYYTDRVLRSLLETAMLAAKADGGSVMIYDGDGQTLKIKVAQGLSDAVIANTRVKRGEGIAGLVASEPSILLIDEQTHDARITSRMNRRELVSSLVAPLTPGTSQEPIGVLSLRTSNFEKRFSEEHVELLRRLLDLAGAALGSLRLAFSSSR